MKWALSIFTTIVLLWVFFFVPIGSRTLWDHVTRIGRTEEAQDLGRDVRRASEQVWQKARNELGHSDAVDGGHARRRAGRTAP